MTVEFFLVGGAVRDEIMGVKTKDIDFSVIAPSFEDMSSVIESEGMVVVQSKPEFGTIRAVARKPFMGHSGGLDFVWAREEGPYSDGRRPDWTKPGSLLSDLSRRDFTMNAIARDSNGRLIDPFNGQEAIARKLIKCVGNAEDRLREDALRGLRALRFAITKDFRIDSEIISFMRTAEFASLLSSVSKERQREEMEKMFAHDTAQSLVVMNQFIDVLATVFSDGLRLSATMKA